VAKGKSKLVFKGKIFSVNRKKIRLAPGRMVTREWIKHPGAAGVLALTDKGQVVLVEQFRPAVDESLLEIPAGLLPLGEEPVDCARRELEEETGYQAKELVKLAEFYTTPGCSDEVFHLFLAQGLVKKSCLSLDEDEELTVKELRLADALQLVKDGRIKDGKTVIALLLAKNWRGLDGR
jgi:ADP-ribose pyrophosphatase